MTLQNKGGVFLLILSSFRNTLSTQNIKFPTCKEVFIYRRACISKNQPLNFLQSFLVLKGCRSLTNVTLNVLNLKPAVMSTFPINTNYVAPNMHFLAVVSIYLLVLYCEKNSGHDSLPLQNLTTTTDHLFVCVACLLSLVYLHIRPSKALSWLLSINPIGKQSSLKILLLI